MRNNPGDGYDIHHYMRVTSVLFHVAHVLPFHRTGFELLRNFMQFTFANFFVCLVGLFWVFCMQPSARFLFWSSFIPYFSYSLRELACSDSRFWLGFGLCFFNLYFTDKYTCFTDYICGKNFKGIWTLILLLLSLSGASGEWQRFCKFWTGKTALGAAPHCLKLNSQRGERPAVTVGRICHHCRVPLPAALLLQ